MRIYSIWWALDVLSRTVLIITPQIAAGNKEEFVKYIYHHMERQWGMVKRLSKGKDRMLQAVAIVDLEGLTLRQVTSLDGKCLHLYVSNFNQEWNSQLSQKFSFSVLFLVVVEAAIRCIRTFEANHPETVKAAVVVNGK